MEKIQQHQIAHLAVDCYRLLMRHLCSNQSNGYIYVSYKVLRLQDLIVAYTWTRY